MSWKKDIEKTLKTISESLNSLKQADESNPQVDASQDFASNQVITKRAWIESLKIASMIEKGDAPGDVNDLVDIETIYKLQFPNNRSFLWQWWLAINQECDWWVQSCRIVIKKDSYKSIDKLAEFKKFIKLAIMFGSSAIWWDEQEKIYKSGYIVRSEGEKYFVNSDYIFNNEPTVDFENKTYKTSGEEKEINKDQVVNLTIRDSGVGDIVWTLPILPLKIYADWLINNNASNCIIKGIMIVKDWDQSDIEIRRFRAPNAPVLRQIEDKQTGHPANDIIDKKLGENASKTLLDLIQWKKWLDETFDKFMGKPSTSASQSKVSGEFVAGQSAAIYLADLRYERINDAIINFNNKFREKLSIDSRTSPLVKFWDIDGELNNGQKSASQKNNGNSVDEGQTRETLTPENNGGNNQ